MEKKKYKSVYAGYVYDMPSTYWTSPEIVKQHLTKVSFTDSSIRRGGIPIISDGEELYVDTKDGNTAIIASSGMKKSICVFMPLIVTLAKAHENMVITDPKGELYNRTSGLLQSLDYNVLVLDFRTMNKDCFNILYHAASVYRNGDKDRAMLLLSDIINSLTEEQKKHAKDPFWPDTAALWLNGTGAIMMDAYPNIDQINVLNWSDFNVRSSASLVDDYLIKTMENNTTKAALKQCLSSAENTFKSILISASSFLMMFNQNAKIARMLSRSTFTLEDLMKPKTALYLITDDTTCTADAIIGIIINQIQRFLIDKAYRNKNCSLETRMNFVLDEFASLPIANMDKALATHRSRNIRYYICVQSLALLKERYGDSEKLLSNCNSILYLGSTELELLQDLETKLGKTNVTPDGIEKPLCSQAELMTLKKTWNHKEAIYMNLSEAIRLCTMLPSIESYNIGNHPIKKRESSPPPVEIYTVEEFVNDVLNDNVNAPFSTEQKQKTTNDEKIKEKKCSQSSLNDNDSEYNLEEKLRIKLDELFSEADDD